MCGGTLWLRILMGCLLKSIPSNIFSLNDGFTRHNLKKLMMVGLRNDKSVLSRS
jgi:hypothetical protein